MGTESDKWFVDEFRLRSPVEEFEDHVRFELEQIRASPNPNVTAYQKAAVLVAEHLRRDQEGASA